MFFWLPSLIRYYILLHLIIFLIGMFDFVRIPHIPNWRQLFWTLKFEIFHPGLSPMKRVALLWRQFKVIVAFILLAPWWLLEELYNYREVELPQMVFIICTPRTGSTNLHRIMARDSRVLAPTLTDMLAPFISLTKLGQIFGNPDLPSQTLEKFIMFLNGNFNDIHRFHDTGVNVVEELGNLTLSQWFNEMIMPPYFHPDILENYPIAKFPKYLKQRILDYAVIAIKKFAYLHKDEGHPFLVCKTIEPHIFDVNELEKRFPNAKFITLVRDPKKQICSRFSFYAAQQKISHDLDIDTQKWGGIISERTRESSEFVMQYFFREKRKNCLALTFQEFIADLPKTYAKIYDFIGAKYEGSNFEAIVKKEVEEHKKFSGKRKYKNVKFEDFKIDEEKFQESFAEYYSYC